MNMTHEEILEQQVEALETLNQLKTAVIEELKAKVHKLESEKLSSPGSYPHPYQTPSYPCNPLIGGGSLTITACAHQYPSTWGGTGAPSCVKCGQPSYGNISVTGLTGTIGGGFGDISGQTVGAASTAMESLKSLKQNTTGTGHGGVCNTSSNTASLTDLAYNSSNSIGTLIPFRAASKG